MEIQICQSCGIILRGKSKFCTGCGSTISKFSPTPLPSITQSNAPLALAVDPDPLVVERAMNRVQYAQALKGRTDSWSARRPLAIAEMDDDGDNGNGHNGGNGHGNGHGNGNADGNGHGNDYADEPVANQEPMPPSTAAAITSRLQNVLGSAAPSRGVSSGFEPMQPTEFDTSSQHAAMQAPDPNTMSPEEKQAFLANNGLWEPEEEHDDDFGNRARSFHENDNFNPPASPTPATPPPASAPNVPLSSALPPGIAATAAMVTGGGLMKTAPQPTNPPVQVTTAVEQPAAEPIEEPPQVAPPVKPEPPKPAPGAFDFFAATQFPASQPGPSTTSSNSAATSSSSLRSPDKASKPTADSFSFEQKSVDGEVVDEDDHADADIPAGMPAVVAKAMKAASAGKSRASSPASSQEEESDESPERAAEPERKAKSDVEGLYPDESVNRGKKPRIVVSDDKDDDDDDDGSSADDDKNAVRRFRRSLNDSQEPSDKPSSTINIGPLNIPRGKFIAGMLCLFVGVPVICILFNLIGAGLSSLGQAIAGGGSNAMPSLNGRWDVGVLDTHGNNVKNVIWINQTGASISGRGMEPGFQFVIAGNYIAPKSREEKPQVIFVKTYVDQQFHKIEAAKPVTFKGIVDWVNPGDNNIPFKVHVAGEWLLTKRVGFFIHGKSVTLHNHWEGGLIEPGTVAAVQGAGGTPIASAAAEATGGGQSWIAGLLGVPPAGSSPAAWSTFYMRIVGFLLLIGMGIVFASLKLFGPAGMINIWAKKEYIPSQFKSQHFKMVREFGQALRAGGVPLGTRVDWNIFKFWLPVKLAIPPEVRNINPHMLVLGAGSKGKSRLLASMIAHDIESADRAVVVVDSDGGLVDLTLAWIASHPKAKEFAKRLVVIDPTHGSTFAYNPLEYPDDGDLQNAASAVVFGFKAIYTEPPGSQSQWNQQTADILRNSAILLMANGKTLVDLPVLLSENDFRDVLLEKIERQKSEKAEFTALVEAWARYKRMARTDQWINWIEPILNRVNPMLGDPRIRPILTKPKGDLILKDIIAEGKILLVKVPQGHMDQNANLLGSLLVTGLKQAALSNSLKTSQKRKQCALYLDEFDNFIEKDTFDTITSETKKFGIGFVGASKTLQGLPEDYRNQIIINVGTMCVFALAKKDGDMLGPQMFRVDGRKIKNQTLQNIFNKVNTTPQFELITDEEKLNIDRVVGQEERTYFCYRVGTIAGVFQMKAPEFKDIPHNDVNWGIIEKAYGNKEKSK